MSDIIYLTITGEQQGCISSRCGTSASIGNRWQIGHEDEILRVFRILCHGKILQRNHVIQSPVKING